MREELIAPNPVVRNHQRSLSAWIDLREPARSGSSGRSRETRCVMSDAAADDTAPLSDDLAPILDVTAIMSRVEGDRALLCEMIDLFLDDAPNLLERARIAVERRDPDGLRGAAHALKGTLGVFAAHASVRAAEQLEHLARTNRLDELDAAFADLQRELDHLCPALAALARMSR